MSNIFSNDSSNVKKKQIKLKPIQVEKHESTQQSNLEEVYTSVQDKIQQALQELQQLEQTKENMLQEAKAEIDNERHRWQEEKQILIKEAQEQGYHDGFETGKQESIGNYQHLLTKANGIIETATIDYHATLDQSDETIVDLAIHTAEKIIKQRMTEEPSYFLPIVKAAIKEIKDQSILSIYLHPDNYESVVKQKDELMQLVDSDTKLSIHVKDELEINSCLIEHPFGKIDASVDAQLKQLRNVLHDIAGEA